MEKGSEKQQKKYRIPLVGAIGIVFLIVVMILYSITTESMVTYYTENDADIELVSVSPAAVDGVSQDAAIVLEWNRPVSQELADEVRLRPSARGEWFVSGNYLMFTPRQLAAGTFYTVSIPQGTVLTDDGEELQETIFFSFETEDPDLRVPKTEAFDVDGRGFRFSEKEDVAIPVNLVGDESTVDISIYSADSSEDFIHAFAELFSYPSWAALSIARYRADDRGFDKISESSMAVRSQNGMSYVDLGSLPEGQYLVRIGFGKDQYDVPVTVSSVNAGVVYENRALALWSHADGYVYNDAEIIFGEETYETDENGFVSIPCNLTENGIRREPEALALTIRGDKGEIVHFLTADDIRADVQCDLMVSKKTVLPGDSVLVSGAVFGENKLPLNGEGTLQLVSSVETVMEKRVKVENGFFTAEWDNLHLANGKYRFIFRYDHRSVADETIYAGSAPYELRLSVEKSEDTIENGESVRYVAKVTDAGGKVVTDASVSMNGEAAVAVDKNGETVFRKAYQIGDGLSSVQKNARFNVISPYGDAEEVIVSVSVVPHGHDRGTSNSPESVSVQKDMLPLLAEDRSFTFSTEEQSPILNLTYYNDTYGMEIPASPIVLTVPERVDTALGENITLDVVSEGSVRVATVSLCKGRIPDALCGNTLTNEGFSDHSYGTMEEQRVFFSGEEISAAFSSVNRRGDYYFRVAVKDVNNKVYVNYIPVTVDGVTVDSPDHSSFASGHMATLPFRLESDRMLDYTLTVGDETYSGTADGDFTVYSDISSSGQYHGSLVLSENDVVVATKEFDFEVYRKTPMFNEVVEGADPDAYYTCQVKADTKDAFSAAYSIMALPGDQILQRMGNTLFYHSMGNVVHGDLSDLNYDLSDFQNSDGSFGRYDGAPGDLLLSVFVAEQEEFVCDRASLCAYLKYRLQNADNPETAAMACWGLSCFNIDCSDSMQMVYESSGKTDRVLLYLAEGYEAAGNRVYAEKIYGDLKKELIEEDGKLHLPDSDDQYNIANTAFMLDLSLKLDHEESQGLLDFLVNADIQIQSGRYLLLSSIVRMVDGSDYAPIKKDGVKNGYVQLSVKSKDLGDIPVLATSFMKNGETIGSVSPGQTADMVVQWEVAENSIYLVYVSETNGTSVIEKDGMVKKKGYAEYVTNVGSAKVSFKTSAAGEGIAPKVYILDLTTGRIVGCSDESGWKVTK